MYTFILNPVARNGKAKAIMKEVSSFLDEKGVDYEVMTSEYAGHSVELAREAVSCGRENIIAVGGDGTVQEITSGIAGHPCNYGIIPAGTGNDFVRSLGIPLDPVEAMSVILSGVTRPVDVGMTSEGRCFMNVAGTGFDTDVIRFTERFKAFHGKVAYILGILTALFVYRCREVTVKTEEREFTEKLFLIAIANGKTYAGGLKVAPAASPFDGCFDITVLRAMPNIKIPFVLGYFANGRHDRVPGLYSFRCRSITISCPSPSPINMDGEVIGETPMTFSVSHHMLNMYAAKSEENDVQTV